MFCRSKSRTRKRGFGKVDRIIELATPKVSFFLVSIVSLLHTTDTNGFAVHNPIALNSRNVLRRYKRYCNNLARTNGLSYRQYELYNAPGRTEFWLDLRSTSFFPEEAMRFLHEIITNDGIISSEVELSLQDSILVDLVDRILVSEPVFKEIAGNRQHDIPCLFVSESYEMFEDSVETRQSRRVGKGFFCTPETLLDPLDALQVKRKGEWILFDSDEVFHQESSAWMVKQVSSVIDLLESSDTLSLASTESGILLSEVLDSETSSQKENGGVAMFCPTKEALLAMDSICALKSQFTGVETESGILIASDEPVSGDGDNPSALVLPFDALLWKTAIDIFVGKT